MTEITPPNDPKVALGIVCLFLAQSGDPHLDLGFTTQSQAFNSIGQQFNVAPATVKNERDAFDRYSDSERVGWTGPLRRALQNVFDLYAKLHRSEQLELSKQILELDWMELLLKAGHEKGKLFQSVVNEKGAPTSVRLPADSISIEFSNTGIRSNGWFVLTFDQILTTIEDLIRENDLILTKTSAVSSYVEATWRTLFGEHLSNEVANTMGKVQTLPLFELLSKIIHFSNSSEIRVPRKINLSLEWLENAKEKLLDWRDSVSNARDVSSDRAQQFTQGGENVIFYGAPGTGKSKTVDGKIGDDPVRTVFHPDLQNSDFFGSLKPQMNGENVEYHFVPGPFMQAISRAYNNPEQTIYLVIEELNRAPAAAVFGDLFLLLDRDDYGEGEYDVSFPSIESRKWFEGETDSSAERLRIPSNLTIYATMNSADQGVFPIDTAFRRRWRQEYLPLDYTAGPDGEIGYIDSSGNHNKIPWRDFVRILNNRLVGVTELGIAEDRLLGQWFVKAKELDGDLIPEKVLLYLWDDLLRHGGREMIFDNVIKTYGDLNALVVKKERVLSEDFLAELSESSKSVGEPVPESSEDGTG